MYTTYHLASAQEVNNDILEAIKAAYKTKPITITVEEQEEEDFALTTEMKHILDQRMNEDQSADLTAEVVMSNLKKKLNV